MLAHLKKTMIIHIHFFPSLSNHNCWLLSEKVWSDSQLRGSLWWGRLSSCQHSGFKFPKNHLFPSKDPLTGHSGHFPKILHPISQFIVLWQDIRVKVSKIFNPISIYHPLMRLSVIIVNLQGNYNRKIAPFVFDEDTWSNIPANVSVSMAVTDILKIEEVDHVYTMKFRLVLEW